jgi:hypothetical protein
MYSVSSLPHLPLIVLVMCSVVLQHGKTLRNSVKSTCTSLKLRYLTISGMDIGDQSCSEVFKICNSFVRASDHCELCFAHVAPHAFILLFARFHLLLYYCVFSASKLPLGALRIVTCNEINNGNTYI